jgi:hypothetical protein
LSASAPAAIAAKASVGVATPGTQSRPAALAARITVGSPCGITISRPPALATSATCAGASTVPAPISARSPNATASFPMLARGSGELSGTSIATKPAASNASPIATTSSGRTPRRIAISGRSASAFITAARRRARSAAGRAR